MTNMSTSPAQESMAAGDLERDGFDARQRDRIDADLQRGCMVGAAFEEDEQVSDAFDEKDDGEYVMVTLFAYEE